MYTWYLVSKVLQTPVNSIIATRNGMKPLVDMMAIVLEGVKPVGMENLFPRCSLAYITLSLQKV